jgi:small subunit ribosomal protein S1
MEISDNQIVTGIVVNISEHEILVDIGYKILGVITSRELSIHNDVHPGEIVNLGEQVEALVMTKEDKDGRLILSKMRAQLECAWRTIEKKKENDEMVEGVVIEVVKGGLVVDVGLRAFLPASLVELRRIRDLAPYVGKLLQAKIIEIDRNKNVVLLSRRAYLEEAQRRALEELFDSLHLGGVYEGVVCSVVGPQVSPALTPTKHKAEIPWSIVDLDSPPENQRSASSHWRSDFSPKRRYETKSDATDMCIHLGNETGEHFNLYLCDSCQGWHVGHDNEVCVYVDLGGFDGVVSVEELSWNHVDDPRALVAIGDRVNVKILDIDYEREHVSLSIRQTQTDPWEVFASVHEVDQLLYGRVTKLVPFGCFVQVGEGIEGLVHISEMSALHVETPEQVMTPGDSVWVKLLDLDLGRRRLSLSIKQVTEGGYLSAHYLQMLGVDELFNTDQLLFIKFEDNRFCVDDVP